MAAVEPVRPRDETLRQRRESPWRHSSSHPARHAAAVAVASVAGTLLGASVADVGNAVMRVVLAFAVLILLVRQLRMHGDR